MGASDLDLLKKFGEKKFATVLADPPWRFNHRTGKMSPEYKKRFRYPTMSLEDIKNLPVKKLIRDTAHLYLWVPNALLREGLIVMKCWGFSYKTNLVWYKIRKDGGPDCGGLGFYFRNTTEIILFGVHGKMRTLQRSQENIILSHRREHSRKPEEQYKIIESCSEGPRIELFARGPRKGWYVWGNQADNYSPD